MLPAAYGLPAAIALFLGGAITCFAGYRFFRIVLGIHGFILGAMIASSTMGTGNTVGMLVAAVVGGLVGAIVMVMAYFLGVALIGAGLAVLVGSFGWAAVAAGDPPALAVIVVAIAGAIGAMMLQRYVIIVGTAFGGAWTMVIGITNALATRGITPQSSGSDVWILYPTSTPGMPWAPFAWIALGVAGTAVQLLTKGKKR